MIDLELVRTSLRKPHPQKDEDNNGDDAKSGTSECCIRVNWRIYRTRLRD